MLHSYVSPAGMRCKAVWNKELKSMPLGGEAWLSAEHRLSPRRKQAKSESLFHNLSKARKRPETNSTIHCILKKHITGLLGSFSVQPLFSPWPDECWEQKWVCTYTIWCVRMCCFMSTIDATTEISEMWFGVPLPSCYWLTNCGKLESSLLIIFETVWRQAFIPFQPH